MLIGIGHDLQRIADLGPASALRTAGVFFTEAECAYFDARGDESVAGVFAAKEALFKSVKGRGDYYWTDVEVRHDERGAPFFALAGVLGEVAAKGRWRVELSISHSGEYASAMVVVCA